MPFRPGQSGNPSGRPKTLIRTVRAVAGHDVAKAITFLKLIALGSDDEVEAFLGHRVKRTTRERILAAKALLDRTLDCPRKHLPAEDDDEFVQEVKAISKITEGLLSRKHWHTSKETA